MLPTPMEKKRPRAALVVRRHVEPPCKRRKISETTGPKAASCPSSNDPNDRSLMDILSECQLIHNLSVDRDVISLITDWAAACWVRCQHCGYEFYDDGKDGFGDFFSYKNDPEYNVCQRCFRRIVRDLQIWYTFGKVNKFADGTGDECVKALFSRTICEMCSSPMRWSRHC